MTNDRSDNVFSDQTGSADWFDSVREMFETPSIPKEWMEYLHKIYAYLDIGSFSYQITDKESVSLIKIEKSGWILHDYGSHIAVSSGDYAHGPRESDKIDNNTNPGYGTIVAQSWNSAQKIVELAKQRWPEDAQLLGGTPFMQFAAGYWAWFNNYEIFGLAIQKSDELAYQQIKTLLGQTSDLSSEQRPR